MNKYLCILILTCVVSASARTWANDKPPAQRSVAVEYSFQISDLKPGQKLRVWWPVPQTNAQQTVDLSVGSDWKVDTENKYGNRIAYAESIASDSSAEFKLQYNVTRSEFVTGSATQADVSDAQMDRWLAANKLVPLSGEHLKLLKDLPEADSTMAEARQLYQLVLNHVDYRKDQPGWGRGDAVWVCDSRFGNCTDFHSLFIALARARKIPAKFEIGFSIPAEAKSGELKGYHCWAWFYDQEGGWIPVDISEADKHPGLAEYYFSNLTADRIALSQGRDIVLNPPQEGPPLNFFIAPYAEVDGQPIPSSQIKLKHSWHDVVQ